MADDDSSLESSGSSLAQMPLHRRLEFFAFGALVVLAAVFYVWWGVAYNAWLDNGVYAVVIVLALFGLAGMWLVMPSPTPTGPPTSSQQ
jgi:heme A synthase